MDLAVVDRMADRRRIAFDHHRRRLGRFGLHLAAVEALPPAGAIRPGCGQFELALRLGIHLLRRRVPISCSHGRDHGDHHVALLPLPAVSLLDVLDFAGQLQHVAAQRLLGGQVLFQIRFSTAPPRCSNGGIDRGVLDPHADHQHHDDQDADHAGHDVEERIGVDRFGFWR